MRRISTLRYRFSTKSINKPVELLLLSYNLLSLPASLEVYSKITETTKMAAMKSFNHDPDRNQTGIVHDAYDITSSTYTSSRISFTDCGAENDDIRTSEIPTLTSSYCTSTYMNSSSSSNSSGSSSSSNNCDRSESSDTDIISSRISKNNSTSSDNISRKSSSIGDCALNHDKMHSMENDLNLYVDTSNKRDDGNEIEIEIKIDNENASDPKITENISIKSHEQIEPLDFNHQNFLSSGFSFVLEEKIDDNDNNDDRRILSDKEYSLQNVPQPIKDYTQYLKEKKTEEQKSLEKNLRIKQKREEYSARVKVRNTNAWKLMTIEEQNLQKLHRKNQISLSEKVCFSNLNYFSYA